MTGIEPALSAWEADVLPLNYTRFALCAGLSVAGTATARLATVQSDDRRWRDQSAVVPGSLPCNVGRS